MSALLIAGVKHGEESEPEVPNNFLIQALEKVSLFSGLLWPCLVKSEDQVAKLD